MITFTRILLKSVTQLAYALSIAHCFTRNDTLTLKNTLDFSFFYDNMEQTRAESLTPAFSKNSGSVISYFLENHQSDKQFLLFDKLKIERLIFFLKLTFFIDLKIVYNIFF